MFSPDVAIPSSVTARNPRRRQRTGSEDSVALRHPPKRIRRSVLSSEKFQPPETTKQNGHIETDVEEPAANGHVKDPEHQRLASVDATSLAIRHRGVKRIERERRSSKSDGSVELTRNDNYIVTQLPSTPDFLKDFQTSGKWHGEISSQLGYALAMTQDQATIWRYVQGSSSTENMSSVNVKLMNPSNNPRHPLPLGILVPTSAEPGLLVVMPTSGKITYWESLSNAASTDASRQKQQSIQGIVPGLMSGESVTTITEAEPRGFILTMDTGRLAHLLVSDPQGKPSINLHFLRDNGASSGGVFGSLRGVFGSAGWRKDVAAVRAGSSCQRGQRYVVVVTKKGTFQTWELSWNGTHTLVNDVEAKGPILQALVETANTFSDYEEHLFEVLDFTILPSGGAKKTIAKAKQNSDCKLIVLISLQRRTFSRYVLIEMTITNGSAIVEVVHPITCYKSSIPLGTELRPQVVVPDRSQTAFITFEKTLVVVSLAEVDETPDSQLQMEAHTLPDPFQDAIDFSKRKPYRIVGCAAEPYDRGHAQPSCVVMIYGFGLIRIAALPLKEGQSALERVAVTAKMKIEQAVFYGNLQQDLLDFSPRPEIEFSSSEIEAAALSVSQSIMNSTSMYIPAIGPSMDQQLQRRVNALAELNKYLKRHYQSSMSRLTKWKLLWNAEKMSSARAIWRCYSSAIMNQQEDPASKNLLTETIEAIHEDYKTENQPQHYETDGVRHWLIHDAWRLEHILPWAQNMVEILFQEAVEDHRPIDLATQARLVSEANDIQLAGLETAFKFREANVAAYGLENEVMVDGVLQRGFDELPEFWTSTGATVERVKTLTDLSRELTKLCESSEDVENGPSTELIVKLAADNPRQVQICCQTYIERFRWLKSRQEKEGKAAGEELMRAHFTVRKALFAGLSDVGQPDMGIQLAEKYRDMDALVEIISQELESVDSDGLAQMYEERVRSYFTKYGTAWADAYFKKHLDGGKAIAVLTNNDEYKPHLTKFLRSHPLYAKLGWINEVASEKNYLASANNLSLVEKRESNLWSRKIGLSMSKLSLMAATSRGQIKDNSAKPIVRGIDENVAVLKTQEKLREYMKPNLIDALDAEAATDLAMQKFGTTFVSGKPILQKSLEQCLQKLIAMETLSSEGLIDALTLIDDEGLYTDEEGVMNIRFFSALRVLSLSDLETSDPEYKNILERTIWRRCMIQDNWEDINRTELKDDTQVEVETGATLLFKTLKEGYRTGFWEKRAPLPPSSLTEAGTTIKSLKTASHYSKMPDNVLELLTRDMEAEAESLERSIEKGRLEEWWKGVVEAAKAAARAEADEEGEETLRKRNAEAEFERRLAEMDQEASFGKSSSGGGGGDGGDVDDQGDVVMSL